MTIKTFECPDCAERFRVTVTHTQQVVACPHCRRKIRIPPAQTLVASGPPNSAEPSTPVAEFVRANVRACVVCEGKFRIAEQMLGTRIACPLCGTVLRIEDSDSGTPPSEPPEPSQPSDPSEHSKSPPPSSPQPPVRQDTSKPIRGDTVPGNATARDPEQPPVAMDETAGQGTQPRASTRADDFEEADGSNEPIGPAGAAANALGIPMFDADETTSADASPAAQTESTESGRRDAADSASPESSAGDIPDLDLPLALLPPTFDVFDPERVSYRDRRRMGKVVLPDSDEGQREVDQRIVHVWHKGEWVPLVARTPEEQSRYRFWVNTISIAIGLAAVVIAILILLR